MNTKKPSYKKEFFVMFLVVATELIGFGLIIPILPQIAIQFEANGILLGILLAAYSFAQFFANPILGAWSDKIGRKRVLILSKLGTVIAYIVLAYAQTYWLFLIARLIDGFTGGNISVARAYLADVTRPEDRAKGMAIIGMSFGTGFVIGPALGGVLFSMFSSHMIPALVAGSFSLIALVLTQILIHEPKKHKDITHYSLLDLSSLKNKGIQLICIIQLITMVLFSGFETTFSIFTERAFNFTIQQNSWVFFYIGILAFIIQGSMTRHTFKNLKLGISIGLVTTGLGYGLLAITTSQLSLYGSLAILSLGIAIINTHLPAYLSLHTNDNNTGKVMGIYESVGSLSRIIGPLLIYTALFKMLHSAYFIFSLCLLLTAISFSIIKKTRN